MQTERKQCEAGRPYAGSDFQVGEPCTRPGELQVVVAGSLLGGAVCAEHAQVSAKSYAPSISVRVVPVSP